jgi:hypothetical protein
MATPLNRLIKITPDGRRRILSNLIMSDGCGVAITPSGEIYVSDIENHIILKIVEGNPQPITIAGARGISGFVDGHGNAARFNRPSHMIADASGNIYVLDSGNSAIRKVIDYGKVTTLTRLLTQDPLDTIGNLAVDPNGTIYTFDTFNSGSFPFTLFNENFEGYDADIDFSGVRGFTGALPMGLAEVFSHVPIALPVTKGNFLFRGISFVSKVTIDPIGTYTVTTDAAQGGSKSLKLSVEPGNGSGTQVFGRVFDFDDFVNAVRITADVRIEREIKSDGGVSSFGEFFAGMISFVGADNASLDSPGQISFQNTIHQNVGLGINYSLGTWYNISLEFDRIQKKVNVFVDNIHRGEFVYENKVDTLTMLQTFVNTDESLMFVDNILIEQLA